MSAMTHDPHAADAPGHAGSAGLHHDVTDHGDDGEHDDHAHGEEPLGPIDLYAWGAGAVGIVIGIVMALGFAISTKAI